MERIKRLSTWARLGYAARGIVYMLLGWIALSTGRALTTGETVQAVDRLPAGAVLLVALAVGLFGYGAFKIYSAAFDLRHEGKEVKGWGKRGAWVAAGTAYLILAFIAAQQAWSHRGAIEAGRASGSAGAKQEVAQKIAESAGGDWLLILAGLIVIAIAGIQLHHAWKAKFLADMPGCPSWVKPAGQLGYAARAIIIAIIGYYAIKAGSDGARVRNFGDALAVVRASHLIIFKLIAGGLVLFGLVSLMMARFGHFSDDDVVERIKDKVPA